MANNSSTYVGSLCDSRPESKLVCFQPAKQRNANGLPVTGRTI